jgi:hypothetical protein
MKKLLIASIAIIGLASCQREKCWKCTSFPDNPDIADSMYVPRNEELCDMTEHQIEAHVRTYQHFMINGIRQSVVCSEKD